jgi:shikimate kinase
MSQHTLLFLIGSRGTGKSTVGRLLADRLGWGFVDADVHLEAAAGRTIADVFAAEGEAGFRDREAAALAELAARTRHVVATGGGVVLRPANRELLRNSGFIAWLTAPPEAAFARLQGDPTTAARRPNLTPTGGLEEVRTLIAAREPLYRACAHFAVDTDRQSPEAVADAILTAWTGCSSSPPSSGAASPSSSG